VAQPDRKELANLILVAGHAVYVGHDFLRPESDRNWFLQPFQRGEPPFYVEHIRAGVDLAARDSSSLLVFSGGQTRLEAGPRSEGQSYWNLADYFRWWSLPEVSERVTTEEFARDSYENLLFGICRFKELASHYPSSVTVVSWAFKEERFGLHRDAIRFARLRFAFKGVNQPEDLPAAQKGEAKAVAEFKEDPYGTAASLGKKRADRNPFNRCHSYASSCPELQEVLQHKGPQLYGGRLPWV
jgi:hypothetical protein